ncbi:RNA polymerase sigma factor [Celeribacter neptunius]|uniref:RNA polymerase sigma-70 factor, ECF subfamily n=1 Tax=Celeribacter neptunius TaxID=588602 RepID=A0A1I3RFB1_9RHOB|nr:sigma-70 family RNA polymerase sigma factor [Celeribacter neptunius]SFJ44690.1 RNA polymerase sigma-70 factor, ECF subfamily [Celeribacter neptunius]
MTRFREELQEALPSLWRYAFALTRDRSRADDLVQDCAERALRKKHLWQAERPLRPWLAKMALNIHRNALRHAAARHIHVAYDEADLTPHALPSAEQGLEAAELLRRVDALPSEQRDVLLLVVIDGVSYAEAAEVLGIPIGTVMSRISRARAALRQEPGGGKPVRLRSVT